MRPEKLLVFNQLICQPCPLIYQMLMQHSFLWEKFNSLCDILHSETISFS